MDISFLREKYGWARTPEIAPKSWVGRSFFTSRSIHTWLEMIYETPYLRSKVLPEVLDIWVRRKLVTQEECDSLKKMFNSPDSENWVIALTIMKLKAKQKKR
jgi:hypothetical protein